MAKWTQPKLTKQNIVQYMNTMKGDLDKLFCAGGAAANPDLAGDVDLWVLDGGHVEEPAPYQFMRFDNLQQYFPMVRHLLSMDVGSIVYGNTSWTAAKHVQLFHTSCKTIEELLDMFDLSVHAVAFDKYGNEYRHPKATNPGEPIVELYVHDKSLTASRKADFTYRYSEANPF